MYLCAGTLALSLVSSDMFFPLELSEVNAASEDIEVFKS